MTDTQRGCKRPLDVIDTPCAKRQCRALVGCDVFGMHDQPPLEACVSWHDTPSSPLHWSTISDMIRYICITQKMDNPVTRIALPNSVTETICLHVSKQSELMATKISRVIAWIAADRAGAFVLELEGFVHANVQEILIQCFTCVSYDPVAFARCNLFSLRWFAMISTQMQDSLNVEDVQNSFDAEKIRTWLDTGHIDTSKLPSLHPVVLQCWESVRNKLRNHPTNYMIEILLFHVNRYIAEIN